MNRKVKSGNQALNNLGNRLLYEDDGFIFTPKNVANGIGGLCVVGCFVWGFADATGFKVTPGASDSEGGELNVDTREIIAEPITTFVKTLSATNGRYPIEYFLNFKLGPIDENIWIAERATEFVNDVPVEVAISGDSDVIKFIDGDVDLSTGKRKVTAYIDVSKLTADARFLDGVKFDKDAPMPLIKRDNSGRTDAIDGILKDKINKFRAVCELLPGDDEKCDKLDILGINESIEKADAIQDIIARKRALQETKVCHLDIWESQIVPALKKAAITNIRKYRDYTEQEAEKLITIKIIGNTPDLTKSAVDRYVVNNQLYVTTLGKIEPKEKVSELKVTCSSGKLETSQSNEAPEPSYTPPTGNSINAANSPQDVIYNRTIGVNYD